MPVGLDAPPDKDLARLFVGWTLLDGRQYGRSAHNVLGLRQRLGRAQQRRRPRIRAAPLIFMGNAFR